MTTGSDKLQQMILACYLREPAFSVKYGGVLGDNIFTNPQAKVVATCIHDFFKVYHMMPKRDELEFLVKSSCEKYGIVDPQQLINLISYVASLYTLEYSYHFIREKFIKYAVKARMKDAIIASAKTIQSVSDTDYDDEEFDNIYENIRHALEVKSVMDSGVNFKPTMEDAQAFLRNNQDANPAWSIPTGFPTLDNSFIHGGMTPWQMGTVISPPGRGKSWFLVNIGTAALMAGFNVCHILVGDNTDVDVFLRYCQRVCGATHQEIVMNSPNFINSWAEAKKTMNRGGLLGPEKPLGELAIKAYPIEGCNMSDVRSYMSVLPHQFGWSPHLLIVDYVDNMVPTKQGKNDGLYEKGGQLYKDFLSIIQDWNICGWTASQPKVDFWEQKKISLASMAESSKKAHHAAVILGINLEYDDQGNAMDVMNCYISKNRKGAGNRGFKISCEWDRGFFKEQTFGIKST